MSIPELVREIHRLKAEAWSKDLKKLYPLTSPNPPALPDEIRALEDHLGRPLPKSFHELLLTCNGWPGFLNEIDLLSTAQMIDSPQIAAARQTLQIMMDELGPSWDGLSYQDAIVFGVSMPDADIFQLNPLHQANDGELEVVWWYPADIVERHGSMLDFLTMVRDLYRNKMAQG